MEKQWYTLGSFTFPSTWVAVIIAMFLTYIVIRIRYGQEASNWYSNVTFLFIMVWKFSIIVFNLKNTIMHPLTILYFHGGIKGVWLGIFGVFLYTYFYGKRKEYSSAILPSWLLTITMYQVIVGLLSQVYITTLAAFFINIAMIFYSIRSRDTKIVILFTLFQLLIQSIQGVLWNLSTTLYLVVMTFIILFLGGKGNENE